MHELDVTLTDYLLSLESLIVVGMIWKHFNPRSPVRLPSLLLFAALAASSAAGVTSHGFLFDPTTLASQICWRLTLIGIGGVAYACWWLAASLIAKAWSEPFRQAAFMQFLFYAGFVIAIKHTYLIAIINYLPPVAFLLGVMLWLGSRPLMWAAMGLALTFVAAAIQQLKIAIHPLYFNHNALYHLVQGVALALLFIGLLKWQKAEAPASLSKSI